VKDQLSISSERLWQAAADLLAKVGFDGPWSHSNLRGGANNRVFRVDLNGTPALLKAYFQHPDDSRDRLGAEFSFATFAWENGVRALPRPIACDAENRLGLYEFIEGRQLRPAEVTAEAVRQALDFYQEMNRHKLMPSAARLPLASEACFTIAGHLQCVERRLRALSGLDDSSAVNRAAISFIGNDLLKAWEAVTEQIGKQVSQLGLSLEDEVERQDRRLSPSDFGFHNAILAPNGRLYFIDFEYAGWDDPAKMVCDFFCQPAVPVPLSYFPAVTEAVVADLSNPERHRSRITLLFPIYQIKWCCILLNDFLPVGSRRRRFADDAAGQEEQKAAQLRKARHALNGLILGVKDKG
jgi:hypothetical protein